MKKKLIGLLALMLALTLLTPTVSAASTVSGLDAAGITSFTLTPDAAYCNEVTATDADSIAALRQMLSSATDSVNKPENLTEIAALRVTVNGKTGNLTLSRSGDSYYLAQGDQYRKVKYADFNRVVNTIGSSKVYKYSSWPRGSIQTESGTVAFGKTTGVVSGTYRYRRLSGKLSTVKVPSDKKTPSLTTGSGKLYVPDFDRTPGKGTVQVSNSSGMVWEGGLSAAKSYALPAQGNYTVRINLQDDSTASVYNMNYEYALKYTGASTPTQEKSAGEIKFSAEGDDTYLGEVVVFKVTGGSGSDLATYKSNISFTRPPRFFRKADGSQIMLFPVSYVNAVGQHWVEVSYGGESARFTINAKDKKWQRQDLTVSSSTTQETVESQKANEEFERVISPLRSVMDDKKHWSGRFILPVSDERVTTQFGMVRYVNGAPTSVRHGAVDLAVPRGTQVKSTGSGRVLYAGYLQLTGNTVVIEHGYGLKSWYYHMDSLNVNTEDMVKQGDIIGAVGSTGFSTGPHLHFGMSVNNVFINPYTAINTDLLANQ